MKKLSASVMLALTMVLGTIAAGSPEAEGPLKLEAASAAVSDCGSANNHSYFYWRIGSTTHKIFEYSNRTYACENNKVITEIWDSGQKCKNGHPYKINSKEIYTEGVGGKNQTVATLTSVCKSTFGVPTPWGPIGVAKHLKHHYTFRMNGTSARVTKSTSRS